MQENQWDVAIVGAGAAGMLAAGVAARRGKRVLLLERNKRPGRKLGITGKGRCNVTNDAEVRDILENIPTNPRFLWSALRAFPPADVKRYFESLGVPLKTERGRRVFPVSDRAADIVNALERECRAAGVTTLNTLVTGIERDTQGFRLLTGNGPVRAASVILCTGGISYPATGSDGIGHRLARELGHSVTPLRASLVPLEVRGETCGELQGISLKNVELSLLGPTGKELYRERGEMLFTHFGISGPLVLSASAHVRDWSAGAFRALVDLKPALDEKRLDERLLRDFREGQNRDFGTILRGLLPSGMTAVFSRLCGIPADKKVHEITKEERQNVVRCLKAFPLELSGPRGPEEAVVTSGGISVREVNPGTMESKLVPGLYFAGEILDVDAYTGGYNLQIAWSTGYVAGMHAGGTENDEHCH